MIYDVCTYNGEKELFDLRYNILKDVVDEFIVVEFDKTFSGKDKPWYFEEIIDKYHHKFLRYCKFTDEVWNKYEDLAKSSPNTNYGQGAEHWIREFCQKESIKDCITHLKDDDIVFIGDVDEIWMPEFIIWIMASSDALPLKLQLLVYSYWLNNRSNEIFAGTLVGLYKDIKNQCLNHLRSNFKKVSEPIMGWHFTSMGGAEKVKEKLTDSYTAESYATEGVLANLDQNIAENKDFLGRDFKYWLSEEEWPQYLKDNRAKYQSLIKPNETKDN